MALDGIVLKNIKKELIDSVLNGRIDKIYQPEKDEIVLGIRTNSNFNVVFSANSSYPKVHITNLKKENPSTPPAFCMFLRKNLIGGRIVDIVQHDLERILEFHIETKDELGDKRNLKLIIEIMGKHSNIILVTYDSKILDSIKRISRSVSVREIYPGKEYTLPPSQNKKTIFNITFDDLFEAISENADHTLKESIYKSFTGFSPYLASLIVNSLNFDESLKFKNLDFNKKEYFVKSLLNIFKDIQNDNFSPFAYTDDNDTYLDFSAFKLKEKGQPFDSISELIEKYFISKQLSSSLKQKSTDMHLIVNNLKKKTERKVKLYKKELEVTKKMDNYKIKGELVTANLYKIKQGDEKVTLLNFYTNEEITIDLDKRYTPSKNAAKYFDKYNKLKRTKVKVTELLEEAKKDLMYFESLQSSLASALDTYDIAEIKEELIAGNYLRNRNSKKKKKAVKSKPLHFISSDGIDIYVGKNNKQNDELTLKFADSDDTWLHTKDIAGSHVIIKSTNVPDNTLLEAANLAAYHSKAKDSSNVPVDYTLRRHVKKPKGSKPGMVIYVSQKTLFITPDMKIINNLEQKK